jgi:5'-nucleotidase
MRKSTVLLSNDDGIYSPGLKALKQALSPIAKVVTIAPDSQRSAVSKAVSFDRPLRCRETSINGLGSAYIIDGTPSDALILGLHVLADSPPDLVVSGINAGENTSVHSILTSGTCGIAFEAALSGIPAIAFSKDVSSQHFFSDGDLTTAEFEQTARICRNIVEWALKNEFPHNVAWLNVNFPEEVFADTEILITRMALQKYRNRPYARQDPRGQTYYWIWGDLLGSFPRNTDAWAVLEQRAISVTPISLELNHSEMSLDGLLPLTSLNRGI